MVQELFGNRLMRRKGQGSQHRWIVPPNRRI
jgi:hypothetical protein